MAHRNPMDEPCWQLAQASHQLWRNSMLPDGGQAHLNPTELQWQVSLHTFLSSMSGLHHTTQEALLTPYLCATSWSAAGPMQCSAQCLLDPLQACCGDTHQLKLPALPKGQG